MWQAIVPFIDDQLGTAERLVGVIVLGVYEHVWRHVDPPGTGLVTGIVDHSPDKHGRHHTRFLELVPHPTGAAGRSSTKYVVACGRIP